jgi:hypothetical protein
MSVAVLPLSGQFNLLVPELWTWNNVLGLAKMPEVV